MRILCLSILFLLPTSTFAKSFELDDSDRVVFIGNTLIEREQRSGWWELALTTRFPGKKIVFRNLGWSGDTVFGEARAGFGSVADGFKHLIEHTTSLKPTVIIVGYGNNEAFEGPERLPAFVKGLETLLDKLTPTKARIVLLSPIRQAKMPAPLPEPAGQNRNIRLYADAVRDVAEKRNHTFVDLYDLLGDVAAVKSTQPLTLNGIHLTAKGYERTAGGLLRGLGLKSKSVQLSFQVGSSKAEMIGGTVEVLGKAKLRVKTETLGVGDGAPFVSLKGLPAGKHTLSVDGTPTATATAEEWAKGVTLTKGPESAQVEKIRQLIVAKNELYFHRWRPQNITYLYGFRKHEQGKNAAEIPKFDPLVEAKEKEIWKLSLPTSHIYSWTPAGK